MLASLVDFQTLDSSQILQATKLVFVLPFPPKIILQDRISITFYVSNSESITGICDYSHSDIESTSAIKHCPFSAL